MVANGRLEASFATVELQFEVGDLMLRESFKVMTKLTSTLIGFLVLKRNNVLLEIRQGKPKFFSLQCTWKVGIGPIQT